MTTDKGQPDEKGLSDIRPVKFGRYLLLEKIGHGGMAEVYKAVAAGVANFTKVLVIKRIHMRFSNNPSFVEMFVREANMSAALQHPNIVQVFEMGEVEGQHYIAMEFVNGRDLQRMMARANKLGIRFPLAVALGIISETAKGLGYAYNAKDPYGNPLKIIHRDLSPSNIMVSFMGDVKIMDFGVAKAATYDDTSAGMLQGKLGYMSPEQVTGGELDQRSDLFSLGIILFELLTLHRLFAGKSDLRTLWNVENADVERRFQRHPEIPRTVLPILRKLLARDKKDRYFSADEVVKDISKHLYSEGLYYSSELTSDFIHKLFPKESAEEILPLEVEELTDPSISESAIKVLASQPVEPEDENRIVREDLPVDGHPDEQTVDAVLERIASESRISDVHNSPPTRVHKLPLENGSFRLKNRDGHIFGPITYDNLMQLIKNRAVTEDELCSMNEGPWTKLGSIPEVKALFQGPTPISGRFTFKGRFNRIAFPHILARILGDGPVTGRLVIKRNDIQKEIYFKDGRIISILSNIKDELLGEYLVRNRILTAEAIHQGVELARQKRIRLGDALLRLGLIQPFKLVEYLKEQAKEKFIELFTWRNGEYVFIDGITSGDQTIQLDLDPILLMMDGIRKSFSFDDLTNIIGPHRNRPMIREENPKFSIDSLKFTARELRAVHLLGLNRVPDRVLTATTGPYDWPLVVYRVVFILVQLGFYRFERSPYKGTHFS